MTKYKLGSILASAAFLGSAALFPAFASSGVDVSGNGAFSDSQTRLENYRNLALRQLNVTDIANRVITAQNTGNNQANFNTGSNVTINTGNANSNVGVQNEAGKNVADVSGCATCGGSSNVGILGNGAYSDNSVRENQNQNTTLGQLNVADINTNVNTVQNTGNNKASFNTGSTVNINTGDTNSNVDVRNAAGTNVANVSGGSEGGSNANDVTISGNGAFSNNAVRFNDSNDHMNYDQKNHDGYNNYDHMKPTYDHNNYNKDKNYSDSGYKPEKHFNNDSYDKYGHNMYVSHDNYNRDNYDRYNKDYDHSKQYEMTYHPSMKYSLDKNYFEGNKDYNHGSYNKDYDHNKRDYSNYDNKFVTMYDHNQSYFPYNKFYTHDNYGDNKFVKYNDERNIHHDGKYDFDRYNNYQAYDHKNYMKDHNNAYFDHVMYKPQVYATKVTFAKFPYEHKFYDANNCTCENKNHYTKSSFSYPHAKNDGAFGFKSGHLYALGNY